jgi:hypothetical protein
MRCAVRLPPGFDLIAIWLSFWLLYALFLVCIYLWQRKRGKWTRRDGLGSTIAFVIVGLILGAILLPVYEGEVSHAERVRLHRLYPHRHFE